MSFSRVVLQFTIIFLVFICAGCVEDKDYGEANNLRPDVNRNVSVNSNEDFADDNETTLDALINLPFEPIENTFRQDDIVPVGNSRRGPGPVDRRLTVVLRFSPDDTKALLEKAAKIKMPFDTEIEPENWFPAELKALGEMTGNQQLKGKGYSANDFAKAPFLNGSLVRIDETEYFVLILQTN